MNEREQIQKALSGLHASPIDPEEIMKMAEQKTPHRRPGRAGRALLAAAAALAMSGTVAFAADYVINQRNIFFFDTVKALAEAQRTELPPSAANFCEVPGSLEENRDLETPAELVARYFEDGKYGEETLLLEETAPPEGALWERRRVTAFVHDHYGPIETEYLTGQAYAGRLVLDGFPEWDLSPLAGLMTPEAGGQILTVSRGGADQRLVMADALLGYLTEEGERFQISFSYDADARFLQTTEYVLSSAYDECYLYTTRDQVEVLIKAYDGQIWAEAANAETGNAVYFYTTGCTTDEMETILDLLALSTPLQAGR